MATMYGYTILQWLVENGWKEAPVDEEVYGDQGVIDPQTGEEHTPYDAARIHIVRTGQIPDFIPELDRKRFGLDVSL